ncbi:MAG: GNAT family N-acetyltransferase [Desulfosarcinaceae bacterium]|nr:GNAT family N-acetyltransferase [Desulfosarcinaceae bacterium]
MTEARSEIHYRKGRRSDCGILAELIGMAAGGTVDYLFHDLIEGMTPVQVVAHNLARNHDPHGYENAIVAVKGDSVVGMALAFPAHRHGITEEMEAFFPAQRLDHMRAFFSARVEGSWFLDALGVAPAHQRQGIGRHLIERVRQQALERGYRALSLIVFADNEPALALYRTIGFRTVREVPLEGNDWIPHRGGCLLMVCDLDA